VSLAHTYEGVESTQSIFKATSFTPSSHRQERAERTAAERDKRERLQINR